jgi:chromosome segregation ATPase
MRDDIRNEMKDLVAEEMEKYSISKNELDTATYELRKLFTKIQEEQRQHRAWIGDLGRSFQHIKDNENYLYYVKELEKKLAKLEHEVQNDDRVEKVKQEVLAQVESKNKNFVSLRNDFNREVRSIYTEIDSAKKLSGKYKKGLLDTIAEREEALRNEIKNVAFEAEKANQKQIPDVPDYKPQINTLFQELEDLKSKVTQLNKSSQKQLLFDKLGNAEKEIAEVKKQAEFLSKKQAEMEKKLAEKNIELPDYTSQIKTLLAEVESLKAEVDKISKSKQVKGMADSLKTTQAKISQLENNISDVQKKQREAEKSALKSKDSGTDYSAQIKTLFNELHSIKDKVEKLDKETKPKEMKDMFRHVENEVDNLRAEIENIGKKSNNLEKKLSRPEGEE